MNDFETTYKDVKVRVEFDVREEHPTDVRSWRVYLNGVVLSCYTIRDIRVLALDNEFDETSDGDIVYVRDVAVIRNGGTLGTFAQDSGRDISFDYRAIAVIESVPLDIIRPYIDFMLAQPARFQLEALQKQLSRGFPE